MASEDLSKLSKEELIDYVNDLKKQLDDHKYGLYFDRKKIPETIVQKCSKDIPILIHQPEKDIKNGGLNHLLIEGDNYPVLESLNLVYPNGLVDIIYIDPPYNTGNKDFSYNDSFVDEDDGYRPTKWLNFMNVRLITARELLNDDGVIFISIDEHEFAQLKLLCDSIFGEDNFVANIIWYKNNSKGNVKHISVVTEYILCYAKNKDSLPDFVYRKENAERMCSVAHEMFVKNHGDIDKTNTEFRAWMKENGISGGEKKYNKVDENGRLYTDKPLTAPGSKLFYDIIHPATHKPCKVASRGWAYKEESFQELLASGHILFGKDETTCPYLKYYLDENIDEVPTNHIQLTANNAVDLQVLGFTKEDFSYPKPVELIKRLISLVPKKDAVVMDFFAGSGTTAQAVLELNRDDGGNRRFILCTNNEDNIMYNVCYPRIKTILTGTRKDNTIYSEGLPGNVRYFKVDFVETFDSKNQAKVDLAFMSDGLLSIYESCFDEFYSSDEFSVYVNKENRKSLAIYKEENGAWFNKMFEEMKKTGSVTNSVYCFTLDTQVDSYTKNQIEHAIGNVSVKSLPSDMYEKFIVNANEIKGGYR